MVILGIVHSWVYHGVCQSVSLQSPKNTTEVQPGPEMPPNSPTHRPTSPHHPSASGRLQRGFPQAIIVEVKLILRDVAEMLEGLVEPGICSSRIHSPLEDMGWKMPWVWLGSIAT